MESNSTDKETVMTPLFILGQIWGLCAMALIVISFQCKKPARLCIIQVCACLFFVLIFGVYGLGYGATNFIYEQF